MKLANCLLFMLTLSLIQCSEEPDTGIYGEWEGTTMSIVDGEPRASVISADVMEVSGTTASCDLDIGGVNYVFDVVDNGSGFNYSRIVPSNLSDTTFQTYLTGEGRVVADTVLYMDTQVVVTDGSFTVSSIDYDLEFKRKE